MPKEAKWAISLLVGLGLLVLGWKFYFVLVMLHVVICAVLIMVVLLQSGKAADLGGAFGGAGSQTAFGPRGAATFLSKATTWCAVMFMLTSIALGLRQTVGGPTGGSVLEQFSKPAPKAPGTQTPQQTPEPQSQSPAPQQQAPQTPPAQPPAKQ